MDWLILTLLAIISRASYSLGTRMLSRGTGMSAATQSFRLIYVCGLLALPVIPFLGGVTPGKIPEVILPLLLMIAVSVAGNIIYFKGQKDLDTGTTQVAFSSILIWGALLSVLFLGSSFSPVQILGMAVMLGALVLIRSGKTALRLNAGLLLIIISAILFAVFQVVSAGVAKTLTAGTYLLINFFGTAAAIGILNYGRITGELRMLGKKAGSIAGTVLFASTTSLLYITFSFLAYKAAPDRGVVVVLLTSQAVLSVIFGIIFLKETDNRTRKLLAGLLAFAAGFLINAK